MSRNLLTAPARLLTTVAVGCLLVSSPPAQASSTNRIAMSPASAVGAGAADVFAYLASPTELVVRSGRTSSTHSVAEGCKPTAVRTGEVALVCPEAGSGHGVPVVLRLRDGALHYPRIPPDSDAAPISVLGTKWLLLDVASSPDGLHTVERRVAINRASQKLVDLADDDTFGRHRRLDFGVGRLAVPLCRSVSRRDYSGGAADRNRYALVTVSGRWTLQATAGSFWLQRCGEEKASRYEYPAILSHGTLTSLRGHDVLVRDLSSGHSKRIRVSSTVPPQIQRAGSHVVISVWTPNSIYRILIARV